MKHSRGNKEDRNKLRQKSSEAYSDNFYLMYNGGCRKVGLTSDGKMNECPNDEEEALKCPFPDNHPHTVHYTLQFKHSHIEIHDCNGKKVWDAKVNPDAWSKLTIRRLFK